MSFQLKTISISPDRAAELVGYLTRTFKSSVDSRQSQIDGNYRRWVDNYAGKPQEAVRTTPFYKASNFVPHLIRMHTDILAARIIGLMFGTRPFWKPKSYDPDTDHNVLDASTYWLERITHSELELFDPLDLGIFLTCKTGCVTFKASWLDEAITRVYKSQGDAVAPISNERLSFDVIPFEDHFPYPVTAINQSQVQINFHRLRFTKEEVEYRKSVGWDKEAVDVLLKGGEMPSGTARESEANSAGISLSRDVVRPFTAVEAWLKYELVPGQMHDIVVLFNPFTTGAKALLRAPYYNYFPSDLNAFVDLRIMPREGLYWGYCVPEILEQSQEEQAQIHNSRRDSNTISMIPGWKKKRLADVANPSTEWYPGKVFEVDSMEDLEPLQFGRDYNSSLEEEANLIGLAERYTGISPAQQGFGTGPMGKKGIYASQATLALLSEGNKRLDIDLKRVRRPMNRVGKLLFTCYRDFATDPTLGLQGENANALKKAFELSKGSGNQLYFELGASDASANKEVDRQNILLMSNTMQAYYKEIVALAPQVAAMPDQSPAKTLALAVLDGARDLANRVLFLFDIPGRKSLVPDLREILGGGPMRQRSALADKTGLPEAEGDVSDRGIQDIAQTVSTVASRLPQSANQVPVNGGRPQ